METRLKCILNVQGFSLNVAEQSYPTVHTERNMR